MTPTSKRTNDTLEARTSGRIARATTCRHCSTPIYTGLDADVMAYSAKATAAPLTPLGRILATWQQRTLYTLSGGRDKRLYRLWQPTARNNTDTVLVAHDCDLPPPAHWLTLPPPIEPAHPPF